MIDSAHFVAFLLPVIAISLVPGPDTLYVLNRSLGQGRFAGLTAALGSATGILGHITLSILGFSALLMASPRSFLALKIIGACYLVYLGMHMLRSSEHLSGKHRLPRDRPRTVWLQGIFTNLLNPKVAVFFLAFIPQFIDVHRGHVSAQFFIFGITLNLIGTSWLCIVALAASALQRWLEANPFAVTWQRRFTGVIFIVFAAKLALP